MLVLLMLLVLYWMLLLLLLCVGGLEVAVAPDTPCCWLLLRLEPAAKCSCLTAPEQQQQRTWSFQRQRH